MSAPWLDLTRVVRWSMTTVGAAALLAAGCEHAYGATLGTWTGPGDSACAGRCTEEWARSKLPEARQSELAHAGAPVETVIRDGAVISLMTYWRGGPVAQHGAVAVLDAPEPATCRVMDGWSWCKVHACQNWTAVEHVTLLPVLFRDAGAAITPATVARGSVALFRPPHYGAVGGSARPKEPPHTVPPLLEPPVPPVPLEPPVPHVPHVPPVPLPASGWLLLAGLAALIARGWRR